VSIWHATIVVGAALCVSLFTPAGYAPVLIALLVVAGYGGYSVAKRPSGVVLRRVLTGIVVGACLAVFAVYLEWARRVSP